MKNPKATNVFHNAPDFVSCGVNATRIAIEVWNEGTDRAMRGECGNPALWPPQESAVAIKSWLDRNYDSTPLIQPVGDEKIPKLLVGVAVCFEFCKLMEDAARLNSRLNAEESGHPLSGN